MSLRSLSPLLALAFVQPALAQNTIVSPFPASATVEGDASNAFPWNTTIISRYMQVHSDVGGSPKLISRIALRRNGATAPTNNTRALDIEMFMGESVPWNRVRYVFQSNYVAPSMTVLPRQVINVGPTVVPGSPAPFELAVPLAAPFPYSGANSLAWECVMYSQMGASATMDTQSGSSTVASTPTLTGPGCVATGQTATMDLGIQHVDRGGAYQFGAYVQNAPANSPTLVFFGFNNFNLALPGLCGNVYHDAVLSVPVGSADATGYIGERGTSTSLAYPSAFCTFVLPNNIAGATIYAQAHSLDAGRTDPLPVCNSNGRSFTVPVPDTTTVSPVSRLYNFTLQGPTYGNATPITLAHGYGAVVEFTY